MPESAIEGVDLRDTIRTCLDLENPKSFFLYAGAGTGKTRTVVEAMDSFRKRYGSRFRRSGQKVAVITYTNGACDEIRRRIEFDPIFDVSTIHSFAWKLIRNFHPDISAWLRAYLREEIGVVCAKQASGRSGTQAAKDRLVQIETMQKRLENLEVIKQFTYSPNGENFGKNSLNHSEVLGITASLLNDKPLMRQIVIRKYPILLIDESQDTQKDLIDAFFALQAKHPNQFCLSLFGDTMQRIYADGKVGLEDAIPTDWEKPTIEVNHRCPRRIVSLLNSIRSKADGAQQIPRPDAAEGVVRLFLIHDVDDIDKLKFETEAARTMARVACDDGWLDQKNIKLLTLEHHMAARRGGFNEFFEPLYRIGKFKTGLLDGTLDGVAFLAHRVYPLVQGMKSDHSSGVVRLMKEHSPIISAERMAQSTTSVAEIHKAKMAVESVFSLWKNGADPLLLDVLKVIKQEHVFSIPDIFAPILTDNDDQNISLETDPSSAENDGDPAIDAWREALSSPFSQFVAYFEYISDQSCFGTHQGIKGQQFPRVMVILDDNEARGFMFSYEKLLGAKTLTRQDQQNQLEGKETSVERTRRLFYVSCSRARQSLAVVVYSKEVDKVASYLSSLGWFKEQEIIRL